ncbi:MAG TPA: hypothetical protein VM733_15600 [Thermoanaerobaculia bacterium]|nr:hypothetical protein [Thermoanaerobaculia bacterium]
MSNINLGPPLSGFIAFFSPSGEGAWSVGKPYPNTGQVVLQMGVNAPEEQPEGIACSAGFKKKIVAAGDGMYSFSVNVQAGPVTMLPRGAHNIFAEIFMTLSGQDVDRTARWYFPQGTYVGAQFGVQTLSFMATLVKGRTYDFRFYNRIYMEYSGVPNPAPYCEIIATYRNVVEVAPGAITEGRESESNDRMERVFARNRMIEREYSDQEMAGGGAIDLK